MKRAIYIFILCAAVLTSCTKFLDIKPYGKVIPQTAEEFSSLLHGIIEEIDYGEDVLVGSISSVADLECYSDNLEANLTKYPDGDFLPLYIGQELSSKQTMYNFLYATIKDCNIVLDNMKDRESELARDVLGTAYALRGVCYYNLLKNFCQPPVGNHNGLGMPLVVTFDMEARPARSTIAKTFALAKDDMLKAISYDIKDDIYRFNNDVMYAYLARLCFWVGDWSNAAIYAQKIIDKYPLMSGDQYVEMMKSEVTAKGNIIFKSYIMTDGGKKIGYDGVKSNLAARPVSKRFVDLFVEKEKDIRYELSFNSKRKYTKTIFACVRTAEMQLILAESLYHTGDETGALEALNELRRNRIAGGADYTMESLPLPNPDEYITVDVYGKPLTPLLNAILNERRKELFLEGDRWYELKRNGSPEFWVAKQGRKYTTRSYMYTFPFPIQDVELVDGMIQNPGYDKVQ